MMKKLIALLLALGLTIAGSLLELTLPEMLVKGVLTPLRSGVSKLTESVYETRFFGYCTELTDMGANIKIDGKTAIVTGRPKLTGNVVCARDLRAGAALIIAGLRAEGTTYVENIHFVERGYERIIEKLRGIGADISRVE